MTRILSLILLMFLALHTEAQQAPIIAIVDGRLFTQSESGVIEQGHILIRDGRIAAVGSDIALPDNATRIDAAGAWVTAGFIASYTGLGLDEVSLSAGANDRAAIDTFVLGAALDVRDAFNPASSLIPVTRLGGVTRAVVAPRSGSGMFAGHGALVHLGEGNSLIVKSNLAMFADFGSAGAQLEGNTRMGPWAILRQSLDAAKAVVANPLLPVDSHLTRADLQALLPVAEGRMPLVAVAHRTDDILRLIALKQERGVEVIVLGASEAWRVADALAKADVPVLISPFDNLPRNFDRLGARLDNATRLYKAGVRFAFYDGSFGATHNARLIPQLAGNAVSAGLPWAVALAAVTRVPAEIWGLEGYGRLAPGAVADVVVWSGDPFETDTVAKQVIIDGKVMPRRSRQTELRDRYKDVSSGR